MARSTTRVLLVGGSAADLRLVREMLRERFEGGCDIEWAGTLAKARARIGASRVHIVLLDLSLPDSTGLASLQGLTHGGLNIPVVVMTSLDDQELATQALREGAQDCLVKGQVNGELLCRSLRYAIERHRSARALRQAHKNESIGRLAGGTAQDFNNILTVIQSASELLSEKIEGSEVGEWLSEIRRAVERGAWLTSQLLCLCRQQVVAPRVLSLNSVASRLERMLRGLVREEIELRTVFDPTTGSIYAHPGQIEQILMNLVLNARDALPEHGRIVIATREVILDENFVHEHPPQPAGRYVELAVSDTGDGMDEATVSVVFEPFFTTRKEVRRRGLGLATAYSIVKQIGGYIWVESAPGRGTTFRIYFPWVAGEPQVLAEQATAAAGDSATTEATILLVEDDPVVRRLTAMFLDKHYRVLVAENSTDALKLCEDQDATIDLLVTDVVMPRLSGPELSRRLTALRPGLKVLYLSAYASDVTTHNEVPQPEIKILPKPFSREQLLDKVNKVLSAAPV